MRIVPGKPSVMPLVERRSTGRRGRRARLRSSPLRRILFGVTAAVVTASLSNCSATTPRSHDAGTIARELVALGDEDQRYRDVERIERMTAEQRAEFMRQAEAADRQHAARLGEIVAAHGWPDATRFGERAARAAFLIVQHADHDVGFQERMLPLLEHAAVNGDVNPTEYAYLVDRVAVARGRPQEYGTQYEVVTDASGAAVADEQGRLRYLAPLVVDPEGLDARRAEAGLGPWAEYERRMAEIQEREPFDGPRAAPGAVTVGDPEDAGNAAERSQVPPPFEAARREPGQPIWQPALNLRALEADYRGDPGWRDAYRQLRAHEEAVLGDHAEALRVWDLGAEPQPGDADLPADVRAMPAVEFLAAVADSARVIMMNERHHAASDRLLTLELLPVLRSKGFRYLALETLIAADTGMNSRAYPVQEATGAYLTEPVFGEVFREARRLGFTLIPYEFDPAACAAHPELDRQQCRDFRQASNILERTVALDSTAKIFVHVGYAHLHEAADPSWTPMALYFRRLSGIDPYTVDQTRFSERSDPPFEHPAYRAAVRAGLVGDAATVLLTNGAPWAPTDLAVDLQVFTPRTTYEGGRPTWMRLGGRREPHTLEVPECREGCVVELRGPEEPLTAVPLDRTEVTAGNRARVFAPTDGPVPWVFVRAYDGTVLHTDALR